MSSFLKFFYFSSDEQEDWRKVIKKVYKNQEVILDFIKKRKMDDVFEDFPMKVEQEVLDTDKKIESSKRYRESLVRIFSAILK